MARKPANSPGTRPEFTIRDRDRERDDDEPLESAPTMAPAINDTPRDDIIQLLGHIGQRLYKSEQERTALKETLADYRRMLEALESKSEQSEKIFLTLQDKLSKQESAEHDIRRRQEALEQQQEAQAERIEKAAAMADRIEEALAQQARLNRRFEKITQDKARFIRKLERIEETVLETQTALQSKALVVLTDQGKAATPLAAVPQSEDKTETERQGFDFALPAWVGKLKDRSTVMVGGLVVLGVIAGLGFAGLEALNAPAAKPGTMAPVLPPSAEGPVDDASDHAAADTSPHSSIDTAGLQPAVPHFEQSAPTPPTADATPQAEPTNTETGLTDAQMNEQFTKDPDALAATLSNIEPGAPPKAAAESDKAAPPPAKPAEKLQAAAKPSPQNIVVASAEPPPAPKAEAPAPEVKDAPVTADAFDAPGFIASQTSKSALADRLKPDPALTGVAKEVEKQAFNGVPEAQHDLAAIYTAGRNGVPVDYKKAAAWFQEAATHNIANAQYNLGVLYHQGLGVPQDTALAFKWYRAAAQAHHPEAQYNLGIAHIEGAGAQYNPKLATSYFKQAARQGVMEASYNLGLIYENGLLGAPQTDRALYWYRTAGDQGSPEGKAALNQLTRAMNLSPQQADKIYAQARAEEKTEGTDVPIKDIPLQDMSLTDHGADKHSDAAPAAAKQETISPRPAPAKMAEANPDRAMKLPVSTAQATPAIDQTMMAQIQEQLVRLNLYPGPANGIGGQTTEDAIKTYQRMNNLPQDGRASQALLVNLLSSELSPSKAKTAAATPARHAPTIAPEALRPDDMDSPDSLQN